MKNHFNQDYFLEICEKITEQRRKENWVVWLLYRKW
jgi:hypothetical protein